MNDKQKAIYERVKTIFGDKLENKHEIVVNKIKNSPELELVEQSDNMLKMFFNDIVFDSNLFKRCIVPPFTLLDTRRS